MVGPDGVGTVGGVDVGGSVPVVGVAVAPGVSVGCWPVGVADGVAAVTVGVSVPGVPGVDGVPGVCVAAVPVAVMVGHGVSVLGVAVVVWAVGVMVTSLGVSVGPGVRLGGDVTVPVGRGARVMVNATVGSGDGLACQGELATARTGHS